MPAKKESKPKSANYHVPNLERALRVIECLARRNDGMSINEIAADLDIPKNSAYRITMTLLNNGYLVRNEESKKLTLSRKFITIGHAALGDFSLVENAMGVMRELRDEIQESVLLGTLLEYEGVVLDQALGGHPFKMMVDPGTRFNLHASAPGKAIMAFLPEPELKATLKSITFTRYNSRTITTQKALMKELLEARESGYALDRSEQFEAIHCVAAPIFNDTGYPVAVIWTTAPTDRIPESRFPEIGGQVAAAAARISARLGYDLV